MKFRRQISFRQSQLTCHKFKPPPGIQQCEWFPATAEGNIRWRERQSKLQKVKFRQQQNVTIFSVNVSSKTRSTESDFVGFRVFALPETQEIVLFCLVFLQDMLHLNIKNRHHCLDSWTNFTILRLTLRILSFASFLASKESDMNAMKSNKYSNIIIQLPTGTWFPGSASLALRKLQIVEWRPKREWKSHKNSHVTQC